MQHFSIFSVICSSSISSDMNILILVFSQFDITLLKSVRLLFKQRSRLIEYREVLL